MLRNLPKKKYVTMSLPRIIAKKKTHNHIEHMTNPESGPLCAYNILAFSMYR